MDPWEAAMLRTPPCVSKLLKVSRPRSIARSLRVISSYLTRIRKENRMTIIPSTRHGMLCQLDNHRDNNSMGVAITVLMLISIHTIIRRGRTGLSGKQRPPAECRAVPSCAAAQLDDMGEKKRRQPVRKKKRRVEVGGQ